MNDTIVDYSEINIEGKLSLSIKTLIVLIGMLCNILSIFVFERNELKKHSYSIYWKAMAFFENIILSFTFRGWVNHLLNVDIVMVSPIFCRLNKYLGYST